MSIDDLTASESFSRYEIIDLEAAEIPKINMAVMALEAPVKATQTDRIETGNNGIRGGGEAKKKTKSLPPPLPRGLLKQRSWSSESCREEAWIRRKDQQSKLRKSKSLTDEDVDELKGCIDLGFGFGFDSEDGGDHKLCDTLPALCFYYAVNKHCSGSKFKSSPSSSPSPSSLSSSSPSPSPPSSSSCDETCRQGQDLDTWLISSPGSSAYLSFSFHSVFFPFPCLRLKLTMSAFEFWASITCLPALENFIRFYSHEFIFYKSSSLVDFAVFGDISMG